MRPAGIHHVSVNVTDARAAVAFYTDVLGGVVRTDRPDLGVAGAWIDLGGQQVHLIEGAVPSSLGQHFAVLVDDMASSIEDLRAKGVAVGDAFQIGTSLQTFVSDPDGNVIELHQPSPAP